MDSIARAAMYGLGAEALREDPETWDLAQDPHVVAFVTDLAVPENLKQEFDYLYQVQMNGMGFFRKIRKEYRRAKRRVSSEIKRVTKRVGKEIKRTAKRVKKEVKRSGKKIAKQWDRSKVHVAIAAGVALAFFAAPYILPALKSMAVAVGTGTKALGGKIIGLFSKGKSIYEAATQLTQDYPQTDQSAWMPLLQNSYSFLSDEVQRQSGIGANALYGQSAMEAAAIRQQLQSQASRLVQEVQMDIADQTRQLQKQVVEVKKRADERYDQLQKAIEGEEEKTKTTAMVAGGVALASVVALGMAMRKA